MQFSSIISPLAAIGMAGGHGTFTEAHILPFAFSACISSQGENAASLMLIAFFGSIGTALIV